MFERARNFLRQMTQPAARHPEDRRSHPRHPTAIETAVKKLADHSHHKALIRNVSRSGVNLLMETPLDAGDMISIEVPHASDSAHIVTMLACVTHISQPSEDLWSAGCEFSLELSDDEMAIFGGAKVEAGNREQRIWVRQSVQAKAEYRILPEETSPAQLADIVNLSPAGIGLLVDYCVETGSVLSITLNRGADKPPLSMLASVVYLTDCSDGRWAAGCNFIRQLSQEELKSIV